MACLGASGEGFDVRRRPNAPVLEYQYYCVIGEVGVDMGSDLNKHQPTPICLLQRPRVDLPAAFPYWLRDESSGSFDLDVFLFSHPMTGTVSQSGNLSWKRGPRARHGIARSCARAEAYLRLHISILMEISHYTYCESTKSVNDIS